MSIGNEIILLFTFDQDIVFVAATAILEGLCFFDFVDINNVIWSYLEIGIYQTTLFGCVLVL